jgi:hypothetical protein
MVHRSNVYHFRMMAMNVKHFLCAAQSLEILDETIRYGARMT